MERILSNDEKIRRAEEIYARRRGIQIESEDEKIKEFNIYKTLFKLLILFNIILVVLAIQNKDYIFKEEFMSKFSVCSEYVNNKVNLFINYLKEDEKTNENIKDTTSSNNVENKVIEDTAQSTNAEEKVEIITEEIAKEQTITEKIKESYSFIKPLEGTVTSFFGDRQSKYQNVTGYHKGIDIGAVSGTKIVSSIDGKVTQVSSKGDYRKAFKNRKWRNNNFICTLFKNKCKRRGRNKTRTRNSTGRKYTVIVQARICILK